MLENRQPEAGQSERRLFSTNPRMRKSPQEWKSGNRWARNYQELPYHLVKIQTLPYTNRGPLGKLFNSLSLKSPHLYNGDNYSSTSGLLKAGKQATAYKALSTAVPGIRNHSNGGNYYCYYYSWNTCVEKAFRDHLN